MNSKIVAILIIIMLSGCATSQWKVVDDRQAIVKFRRGFPVSDRETCDAFNKIENYCPSKKYKITEIEPSEWGGQYYVNYNWQVTCVDVDAKDHETTEDLKSLLKFKGNGLDCQKYSFY